MQWALDEALDELRRPACYPDPPRSVELIVTHISVVCLAGDSVYKLKRAVRLPFLDWTDVAARRASCNDELRLNRRLCPDVYLEVVALRRGPHGLRFGGGDDDGEVVDWAVRMQRMPEERMLDRLLAAGTVAADDVRSLARIVADFHARVARGPEVQRAGAPAVLIENLLANFEETRGEAGRCFDRELHAALAARAEAAAPALRSTLETRAADGRVVEGHGDLHARNICMTEPPSIYDCVEFRLEFRCGDVASDVAFLAMDLRYRGHAELARAWVDEYVARTGDDGLRQVLPELVRYRAMVRAKVAAIAAGDAALPAADRDGARSSARRHLRLVAATRAEDDGPWWLCACGLPASGKTWVLEALAQETGWQHLSTDVVRKQLAGLAPTETASAQHYSAPFSDRTYRELLGRAATTAGCVLLDGNFPTSSRREAAREAARRAGARLLVLWFDVAEDVARQRLAARERRRDSASDAGRAVREALRENFEPPTREPDVVRVDGAAAVDQALDAILAAVVRRGTADS